MLQATQSNPSNGIVIRRLAERDAVQLQAHCFRLDSHDALNLFSARSEQIAVKRYIAGIDFHHDIVVGGLESESVVRATARISPNSGSRWAELILARERERVGRRDWNEMIFTAVGLAREASLGWLSVTSLGYDPETRDALTSVGFALHADAHGTIGELRLRTATLRAS